MTTRRIQAITLAALGLLIAAGVLLQQGRAGELYRRVASRFERSGSPAPQGRTLVLTVAEERARRLALAPLQRVLQSTVALKNPPNLLFGVHDAAFPADASGFLHLERALRYRFPIISLEARWGDQADQQFPFRTAEAIDRLGSVPMITWQPWVTEFNQTRQPDLPPPAQREYASLAAVSRGEYDFYVEPWAEAAARYGKPLFLRFAQDMNDPYRYPWGPQNGNTADDFIAAWRRVHQIFQQKSARNVIWVWSPHVAMPWFDYYYPGDHVVDWIGLEILNYGSVASWSRWWTLPQILDRAYPALSRLRKPMMIAALGTLRAGGDIREWYEEAFQQIEQRYRRVRAVVFLNQPRDVTISAEPLNWAVTQDEGAVESVAGALARLSAQ